LHATKQTAADALNDEKIISQLRSTRMITNARPTHDPNGSCVLFLLGARSDAKPATTLLIALLPGVLFLMFVKRPA
jgi:hypothetical protein